MSVETGVQPQGRLLEGAGQQVRDFIHGDPAGKFPRLRAAHAVAHREDKIAFSGGGLADLAKIMHLMGVEVKPEKGVLVVRADTCPGRSARTIGAAVGR